MKIVGALIIAIGLALFAVPVVFPGTPIDPTDSDWLVFKMLGRMAAFQAAEVIVIVGTILFGAGSIVEELRKNRAP